MKHHRVGAIVAVLIATVGGIGVASNVSAAPPTDVHIEVPTTFGDDSWSFTATGSAVDDGVVCGAGTVRDLAWFATGGSPAGVNFHVLKEFTCDGGGTFQIKLEVRFDRKGGNFRWVIMNGTGPYATLGGTGAGVGLPLTGGSSDGVLDVYDGRASSS